MVLPVKAIIPPLPPDGPVAILMLPALTTSAPVVLKATDPPLPVLLPPAAIKLKLPEFVPIVAVPGDAPVIDTETEPPLEAVPMPSTLKLKDFPEGLPVMEPADKVILPP